MYNRIPKDSSDKNNYVYFETTNEGVRLFNKIPEKQRSGAVISQMKVEGKIVPAIKIPMNKESYDYFKQLQWNEEYDFKMKSRCVICGSNGKSKLCPLRYKNPEYTESNGQPKTLANSCDECPYGRMFKAFHNTVNMSTLSTVNDIDEITEYEAPTPYNYNFANDYMELLNGFVSYIKIHYPEYAKHANLAFILGHEIPVTEAASLMDENEQTLYSWRKKIRPIFDEYKKTVIK